MVRGTVGCRHTYHASRRVPITVGHPLGWPPLRGTPSLRGHPSSRTANPPLQGVLRSASQAGNSGAVVVCREALWQPQRSGDGLHPRQRAC